MVERGRRGGENTVCRSKYWLSIDSSTGVVSAGEGDGWDEETLRGSDTQFLTGAWRVRSTFQPTSARFLPSLALLRATLRPKLD
eukprot:2286050-Rhodomonas_salina.1